jgi:DNA-binding transcriptional ArsR family regulator
MAYESVLAALANPTRRRLLERIRRRPHTVGELAGIARISQPAASQHLQVLTRARLVTHRRVGTQRHFRPRVEGLDDLRRYLESLWDDVLAAYADEGCPPANPKKKRGPR